MNSTLRPRTSRQWQSTIRKLRQVHLAGEVAVREDLPEEVRLELETEFRSQTQETLPRMSELYWLAQRCEKTGMKPVVLNDFALFDEVMSPFGRRKTTSIGLLLNLQEYSTIRTILRDRDYKEVVAVDTREQKFKSTFMRLVPDGGLVEFQLQTKLFLNQPADFVWKTEPYFSGPFAKLAPEHQLMELIEILAIKHSFTKISDLVDMDRLIRSKELNWALVEFLARRLKLTRATAFALMASHKFLETPVPRSLTKRANLLRWVMPGLFKPPAIALPPSLLRYLFISK